MDFSQNIEGGQQSVGVGSSKEDDPQRFRTPHHLLYSDAKEYLQNKDFKAPSTQGKIMKGKVNHKLQVPFKSLGHPQNGYNHKMSVTQTVFPDAKSKKSFSNFESAKHPVTANLSRNTLLPAMISKRNSQPDTLKSHRSSKDTISILNQNLKFGQKKRVQQRFDRKRMLTQVGGDEHEQEVEKVQTNKVSLWTENDESNGITNQKYLERMLDATMGKCSSLPVLPALQVSQTSRNPGNQPLNSYAQSSFQSPSLDKTIPQSNSHLNTTLNFSCEPSQLNATIRNQASKDFIQKNKKALEYKQQLNKNLDSKDRKDFYHDIKSKQPGFGGDQHCQFSPRTLHYDMMDTRRLAREWRQVIQEIDEEDRLIKMETKRRQIKEGQKKFIQKKAQMRQNIEKQIKEEEQKVQDFQNPHLCQDIDELRDKYLVDILNSNDVYEHIEAGIDEQKHRKEIEYHAAQITKNLAQKAEDRQQREIGKLKANVNMNMFIGNKTQMLVNKFVAKLKENVKKKRDQLLQQSNEEYIKQIIEQQAYVNSMKKGSATKTISNTLLTTSKKLPEKREYRPMDLQVPNFARTLTLKKEKPVNMRSQLLTDVAEEIVDSEPMEESSESVSSMESVSDCDATSLMKPAEPGSMKAVTQLYLNEAASQKSAPLPILQRITPEGTISLYNYPLNESSIKSMVKVLPQIIPSQLRKVYLVNNSIYEKMLQKLVLSLFQKRGLLTLGIIKNNIQTAFYRTFAELVVPSPQFRSIRRLVIKDPMPPNHRPSPVYLLCKSLATHAHKLESIVKLTLSSIGINNQGAMKLATAIANLHNLEHLDISGNTMDATGLTFFLDTITGPNCLRSLNLSYNKGQQFVNDEGSQLKHNSLEQSLCNFLHKSFYLLHLDLSGMNLTIRQCLLIARHGFRKSMTLQCVHMCGLNFKNNDLIRLREKMKVQQTTSLHPVVDLNMLTMYQIAKIHSLEMSNIFGKQRFDANRALKQFVSKFESENKHELAKAEVVKPVFVHEETQKIIYQRNLGKTEIIGSHRWKEASSTQCQLCQKMSYILVVWNKHVSEIKYHDFYYKYSTREPVMVSSYKQSQPILCTKDQIHRMIPISEFYERIANANATKYSNVRKTTSDNDKKKFECINEVVIADVIFNEHLDSTYWRPMRKIRQDLREETTRQAITFHSDKIADWVLMIDRILHGEAHMIFDIEKYAKLVDLAYKEENRQDAVNETYVCALYVPSNMKTEFGDSFGVCIKHPKLKGVDYIDNLKIPRNKHLSVNQMKINSKKVKKVKTILRFSKNKSVFAAFKQDTEETYDNCFDADKKHLRVHKLTKDYDDSKKVLHVLREYYPQIKDWFLYAICRPKNYPCINWFDFVDLCHQWKIFDDKLTVGVVDRLFIIVNYEVIDLEENDDNRLCRYEFLEILTRMAKVKFYDPGRRPSIHQSLKELLSKYIVPNFQKKMEVQQFREKYLWNLDMDSLIKSNLNNIHIVYANHASSGQIKAKQLSKDNVVQIMDKVIEKFPQEFRCPYQETLGKVVLAFGLSKTTLQDEMKDFYNYYALSRVEFYEFIGRWAELTFPSKEKTFVQKYYRMLEMIFATAGLKVHDLVLQGEISSESDYDDDLVDGIVNELMKA